MNSIKDRALRALNTEQYAYLNKLEEVCFLNNVECPYAFQYILRMLVRIAHGEFQLPTQLLWLKTVIDITNTHQKMMKLNHNFVYVTVRKGLNQGSNNNGWHVDGFSKTTTHLPEQNYIFSDTYPTEYIEKAIYIPRNFDAMKHNLHLFLQDNIKPMDEIKIMKMNTLYCLDPYIIHRKPEIPTGIDRLFVRITYSSVEILDNNNSPNAYLLRSFPNRDGIKDFRNKLTKYIKP